MSRIILLVFVLLGARLSSEEFCFKGRHFIASYLDCDARSLRDLDSLIRAMDAAVDASGAAILDKASYVFSPDGLTMVYLLSESHASIHTYPEHGACFVDLFTCGDHCCATQFDEVLRNYLQPKTVNARLFLRDHNFEQLPVFE